MWKHVSSPYILKFNGVFYHNDMPAIVTSWMSHGNITEYLEKHLGADRLHLVNSKAPPAPSVGSLRTLSLPAPRCGQRSQLPPQPQHSTRGHQRGKSSDLSKYSIARLSYYQQNILISDSTPPRAVLADFGFTRVTTLSARASSKEVGTVSFMAPELLLPTKFGLEKGVPSKEADVYALGMTVYQALTGKWPFFPRREAEVMHAVISGERPPKPENAEGIGMTEVVWDLLTRCWREDKTTRLAIAKVLKKFREVTGEGKTADSMHEEFAAPQLNTGKRSSAVSQRPSLRVVSCERSRLCSLLKRLLVADATDVVGGFSFPWFGYSRGVFYGHHYPSLRSVRFLRSG